MAFDRKAYNAEYRAKSLDRERARVSKAVQRIRDRRRARGVCTECKAKVRKGERYCDDCKSQINARVAGNKRAPEIFAQYGHRCGWCGGPIDEQNGEIHHKRPVRTGNLETINDDENLLPVHKRGCHNRAEQISRALYPPDKKEAA